ncbi:hypothetical protein ABBQ38_006012 [Trebouxia sp. C0009 RCD-2024]
MRLVHLRMVSAEEISAPAALLCAVTQHMPVVPKAMGASGWTITCGNVCRRDLIQITNETGSMQTKVAVSPYATLLYGALFASTMEWSDHAQGALLQMPSILSTAGEL